MPKSLHLRLHQTRLARNLLKPATLRALIRFLMECASRNDGRDWAGLDVLFTNNEGIRSFKRATFGIDEVTDVITQSYAPSPALPSWTGEIVVNAERASELGPRFGGGANELALYLAHGCDHLTGGIDDTPEGRRAMRRRELKWLAEARAGGLLP